MRTRILLLTALLGIALADLNAQTNIAQYVFDAPWGAEVNTYTGNLMWHQDGAHLPSSGIAFDLEARYNSLHFDQDQGFGKGFIMGANSMRYEIGLTGDITVHREDGKETMFTDNGGSYSSPAGNFETLSHNGTDAVLTTKSGMKYFFADPSHKKITRIQDRHGNFLDYTYNANGELTGIADNHSRSVGLNWSGGHLASVTDNIGGGPARVWQYVYSGDFLTKVIDPLNNEVNYGYDASGRLDKIINARGFELDIVYDVYGTVAQISQGDVGVEVNFDYNSATRTITVDELVGGVFQSAAYTYDNEKRLVEKIGNCCGYHVTYEYDADNNLTKITDANGNETNRTYDAKGNMLGETNALGYASIYTYEPVFNNRTSYTDRNGNTTTYTYDATGNLLQVSNPVYTESHTYDAAGNRTSSTDGKGNTTTYAYNAYGQPLAVTDALGGSTGFVYDLRGKLLSQTDANGCTTTHIYDLLDRRTSSTDPMGHTTSYAYDEAGNRLARTDANGNTTAYTYDALDRTLAVNEPLGVVTTYTYNQKNRVASTDANGNTTTYIYNNQNLLAEEMDALGNVRTYTYDATGNRLGSTDANGNTTTYLYDAIDQMLTVTDALGGVTTYTYDANGNQAQVTDALGNTTSYAYDALNRNTQVTDALGGTSVFVYDNNNNRIQATDANGSSSTYTYDALDRLLQSTNALGGTMGYTYDAAGNQLTATDPNGNTTTNVYDCNNRVTSSTNAAGETTAFAYDPNGNRTQTQLPNGNSIAYTYDALDRVASIGDNLGVLAQSTYDANGNTLVQTDANGNAVAAAYDALNRPIVQTDAMGESATLAYDANGNVLSQTDRNGNQTSFAYDALNRRTGSTDALGNATQTQFDALGRATQLTDANGNATTYTYDALHRLTAETFADATSKNYAYDAVGNITQRTDANGNTTAYTYDALRRLTQRNYPGTNDDNFAYDAAGRMLTANNSNATVSYTYDQANRTLSETLNGQATTYTYDIANNKRTLAYPGGRAVTENYDLRSRLGSINEGANSIAAFTYDAGNRLTQKSYGNGTTASYAYNANNWLTQLTHSNGGNFADFAYTHDKEGNKLYAQHNHKPDFSEQYSYDAIYRLTDYKKGTLAGASIPAPSLQSTYTFDALGNRTSANTNGSLTTYTANTMNAYTLVSTATPTAPAYDNNGNLTAYNGSSYAYDYENRLTAANGSNNYQYDALGRRISKNVNGTVTHFFYDGARVIEEQDAANNTQATYIYGTWIDDVLQMQRGGNTHYHHHNALGSIVALSDNTGNITERYEYDAYGKPTFYDAAYNPQAGSSTANPYLFTGRRYEPETQLYYYRARHHHPELGRFLQRDPLGYVDGLNMYAYVGNNGVNWVDPWGLEVFVIGGASDKPRNNCCDKLLMGPTWNMNYINNLYNENDSNYFGHFEINKLLTQIRKVKKEKPDEPITIITHSWGAKTALKAILVLSKENIRINKLITLDPVFKCSGLDKNDMKTIRENIESWYNVYSIKRKTWADFIARLGNRRNYIEYADINLTTSLSHENSPGMLVQLHNTIEYLYNIDAISSKFINEIHKSTAKINQTQEQINKLIEINKNTIDKENKLRQKTYNDEKWRSNTHP